MGLALIGLFILALGGLLYYAVTHPSVLINHLGVQRLVKNALPERLDLDWETLNAKSRRTKSGAHELSLALTQFCYRSDPAHASAPDAPKISACFKEVNLMLRYQLGFHLPRLQQVGPAALLGGQLNIKTATMPAEKSARLEALPLPQLTIPRFLQTLHWGALHVALDEIELDTPSGHFAGHADIKALTDDDKNVTALQVAAELSSDTQALTTQLALGPFDLRRPLFESPLALNAHLKMKDLTLDAAAELHIKSAHVAGTLSGALHQDKIKVDYNMDTTLHPKRISLDIDARATTGMTDVPIVTIRTCKLNYTPPSSAAANLIVDCPIALETDPDLLTKQVQSYYRMPSPIRSVIRGEFKVPFLYTAGDTLAGQLELTFDPITQALFTQESQVTVAYQGDPLAPLSQQSMKADLNFLFKMTHFQRLVETFAHTPYAVPAPFHVLDGPLDLTVRGQIDSTKGMASFPIAFAADLKSPTQTFDMASNAEVKINFKGTDIKGIDISGKTILNAIALDLPHIDIAPLPQIGRDQRIITRVDTLAEETVTNDIPADDAPPAKQIPLRYEMQVVSATPIQFSSNLTRAPLPISLDLNLSDSAKAQGWVRIENTRLNLFRRDAELKYFELRPTQPSEESKLDALFEIKYADYRVELRIGGELGSPDIILSSDPPLPQSDIISVLLYGEPLAQGDPDQTETSAAISSAISDRAMALASLYFLASTPIERVNYNPASKALSTKIKVGDGTSLVLGTSESQREVGLRRRLGSGWYITTRLENEKEDNGMRGATYLEWYKRF